MARKYKCIVLIPMVLILSLLHITTILAQPYVTQENTLVGGVYPWSTDANWTAAGLPVPRTSGINDEIIVNGYITVGSSGSPLGLSFANLGNNSDEIVINGTLVVYGDVTFNTNAMSLVVNGTMIVFGSFSASNKADVTNGGMLLITGDMTLTGGNQDYNGSTSNDDGTLYVGGTIVPGSGDDEAAIDDNDNIESFPPDIQDFIEGTTTILPITLGHFSVNVESNSTRLNWQTITEENFDFFSIERSEDGENFYEIGTVPGHGNSNDPIDYSFEDENPLFGLSYYRLNAIDYDGTYEKFQVLPVEFIPDDLQVSIYPNPGNGNNMRLRLGLPTEAKIKTVSIWSLSGEQILERSLGVGKNELNLPKHLGKGFYFAKIQIDNYTTTRKLIIN